LTPPSSPRGNAARAFEQAAVQVTAEYDLPIEHHNPMEPFATTVVRDESGRLTVYDKTQGVQNVHAYLTQVFDLAKDELRVLSPFVGGGFGAGLRPQYQVFLAVLAARELKRSVRVVLTREQMFTLGYRPATWQRVSLGAAADGTLEAITHEAIAITSRYEDYSEPVTDWAGRLYRCDNVTFDHRVVRLDVATPLDMRAPGAAWGLFALESAMDELAVALRMDPIELRLKNYTDRDQNDDLPFSSKELRACYRQAAEAFGWARRHPEPRSMRDGHALIGWGMATGIWEASQTEAAAKAVLSADARLAVSSATVDIGTGTYTIMTQLAADLLGLPIERVTFTLGDSSLSKAPVEGGSLTASSVGSAVKAACDKVKRKAFKLARRLDGSPLAHARFADVVFADGAICLARDRSRALPLVEIFRSGRVSVIEEEGTAGPRAKQDKFARFAHSAICAEVSVDEDLGVVRVTRIVSAVAAGRMLNPKTARSQVLGAIVGGIGMALEEESVVDHALGRIVNHNLAEYHVAVNADVPDIDVIFVEERDAIVNPLGVKGIGEIGIVGVAAAIANAVHHATGIRIRRLPITLDKLLS
jgi:xanthine dehydrogenase YagR molybdenum-binding subunit